MKTLGFDSRVFLAPMAGITDLPMRSVVSSLGKGVMVSEMVAINSIHYKNPKSYRIADVRNESYPVVVQLLGNDPALFSEVIPLIEDLGAHSIDINMGCPVKKITNNNMGSALMKDINLASKIVESCAKKTKLKLSIKFRKGWDHSSVNAVEFAKMCESSGADYITIHGRTRSDFYSGEADWNIISEVKNSVKIPVIGNGDIDSAEKAALMLEKTNVNGVMVGRGALGSPWLISQVHDYIERGEKASNLSVSEVKSILMLHINKLVEYYGEEIALPITRKYVCWYCKNLYDAKRFREKYNQIRSFSEAMSTIDIYFSSL